MAYFINLEMPGIIKAAPAELQVRKAELHADDALNEDSGADDADGGGGGDDDGYDGGGII